MHEYAINSEVRTFGPYAAKAVGDCHSVDVTVVKIAIPDAEPLKYEGTGGEFVENFGDGECILKGCVKCDGTSVWDFCHPWRCTKDDTAELGSFLGTLVAWAGELGCTEDTHPVEKVKAVKLEPKATPVVVPVVAPVKPTTTTKHKHGH